MKLTTPLICAMMVCNCLASSEMGKAKLQWQTVSTSYQAGQPLQTAISMDLEEGWHTYWENPGDAGMRMKILWELPAGWRAGELQYPAPSRFTTSGLTSFGYKDEVVFPIILHPPADAKGTVELKAKVSWLVCNEDSCLPGSASIILNLTSGPPVVSDSVAMIQASLKKVPQQRANDLTLNVQEGKKELHLTLEVKDAANFQLLDYEVFPATPEVIGGAASYDWVFNEGLRLWQATVPKSEYRSSPVTELALVFLGQNGQVPFRVNWKIK